MKYRNLVNTPLKLTETIPFNRLKEFCKLGKYRYHIFWDKFFNGVLITCEVFYFLKNKKKIIHRETQFVICNLDENINYPKNIICESFLHNIGLGLISSEPIYNSPTPDHDEQDEINSQMRATLTKVLGRTAQTLSETFKNEFHGEEEEKFFTDITDVIDIVKEGINMQ